MKFSTTRSKTLLATSGITLILLQGCSSVSNIVPQLNPSGSDNSLAVQGQDIAQANEFLSQGKRREAAGAYFNAAQNYPSPERERLILQAAELASVFKDNALTQEYLAPLNFSQLSTENQTRFRLIQAQLAYNDRNYRETLRILPQRVDDIPEELGQKVLTMRMSAAQASSDKLAIVQELVLQEPNLKQDYEKSLNHDRIWNHAKQIPAFQLEEAKNNISHPIVKNWLSLAQLSRVAQNGPESKKQSLRSDLGSWIQNNATHPGMRKALGLLNASPTATVTPYAEDLPKPVVKNTVVKRPVAKSPVVKTPSTNSTVVIKSETKDTNIKSLYNDIKKEIQ